MQINNSIFLWFASLTISFLYSASKICTALKEVQNYSLNVATLMMFSLLEDFKNFDQFSFERSITTKKFLFFRNIVSVIPWVEKTRVNIWQLAQSILAFLDFYLFIYFCSKFCILLFMILFFLLS